MLEQSEKLDSKKIISFITKNHRTSLKLLEIFESIDSTNTYLLSKAKKYEDLGKAWVCLSEHQTQGRGRQGKTWFSPYAKNIYCSILWNFPTFKNISALSLASGVAIIHLLKKLGMDNEIGLKWPNDILFSRRKLAGILLESIISPEKDKIKIVIGIGLNVQIPAEKNNWIGVEEIIGPISRNKLTGMLLDELINMLILFQSQGLDPFMPIIQKYDVLLNKEVTLSSSSFNITGIARGVNQQGEMILDQGGQIQHFGYGEVSLRFDNLLF